MLFPWRKNGIVPAKERTRTPGQVMETRYEDKF